MSYCDGCKYHRVCGDDERAISCAGYESIDEAVTVLDMIRLTDNMPIEIRSAGLDGWLADNEMGSIDEEFYDYDVRSIIITDRYWNGYCNEQVMLLYV